MSVVYKLEPQTWVEDPITGKNEKVKYRLLTPHSITCPHCENELNNAELIKTKNFLIINCHLCKIYTWVKIK